MTNEVFRDSRSGLAATGVVPEAGRSAGETLDHRKGLDTAQQTAIGENYLTRVVARDLSEGAVPRDSMGAGNYQHRVSMLVRLSIL